MHLILFNYGGGITVGSGYVYPRVSIFWLQVLNPTYYLTAGDESDLF